MVEMIWQRLGATALMKKDLGIPVATEWFLMFRRIKVLDANGVAAGINTEIETAHQSAIRTGAVHVRRLLVANGTKTEINIELLNAKRTEAIGTWRIDPVDGMGGTKCPNEAQFVGAVRKLCCLCPHPSAPKSVSVNQQFCPFLL